MQPGDDGIRLGATFRDNHCYKFRVWAPAAQRVMLRLLSPNEQIVPMQPMGRGYYDVEIPGIGPGARYYYRLDEDRDRPDPASRRQPEGVHGPSQIVSADFNWTDQAWHGVPLDQYVIYELHVGTFSAEGTFDGVCRRLDELVELGVTAVELMPVAQFPGSRNWGYDGVHPFAVQDSYGGPAGLKRLVDSCHARGLSVVLDVVYNHLGPEGNYLDDFGPYFTDRHKTPWGRAINFDGAHSDEVRRYFIENALMWITDFHIDALRLDAIHAILDFSAIPFLQELGETIHALDEATGRRHYIIAESDLNDSRVVRPVDLGGYGLDAQWSDDFHHAVHTVLTGESGGYYQDFGRFQQLLKAYRQGMVYTGEYAPTRGRRHGNPTRHLHPRQLVVFIQNHDQIGNRMMGERLSSLLPFEAAKLAAGAMLLSPYIPLLFMGEEYAETAPFLYFVSHGDPALIEAVRNGRREEFANFAWRAEPPDPQAEETFQRSKLNPELRREGRHAAIYRLYGELVALRKSLPSLGVQRRDQMEVIAYEKQRTLLLHRWHRDHRVAAVLHLAGGEAEVRPPVPPGLWRKLVDSSEEQWMGAGSAVPAQVNSEGELDLYLKPWQFVLFERER